MAQRTAPTEPGCSGTMTQNDKGPAFSLFLQASSCRRDPALVARACSYRSGTTTSITPVNTTSSPSAVCNADTVSIP